MGLAHSQPGTAHPLDINLSSQLARLMIYIELARPFTLLLPVVGILSGGLTAAAAIGNPFHLALTAKLAVAGIAAMLLNAASNTLNQVADLAIDRLNKPSRPLVRGVLEVNEARVFAGVAYALAILLAMSLSFTTAALFTAAALATLIYSLPLLGRTKRFTWGSNFTVAIPRGCLLKVAGWSVVAPPNDPQPWILGSIFSLFLLGATTTKDFADVAGDQANGCLTLPVRYGATRAALMIAPFFVLPWWLLPFGTLINNPADRGAHLLSAGWPAMLALATILSTWGGGIAGSILVDPDALSSVENHPAWRGMYALVVTAHLGLVVAYAL
jgi:4-hydroxybenzoate polyprenyltransferase